MQADGLTRASRTRADRGPREKCILVGLSLKGPRDEISQADSQRRIEESLSELAELARSAGADVVDAYLQTRERPDPATLIGRGKADEIRAAAEESGADFILFAQELSATQLRNLEGQFDRRVLDRTQLILDIFAGHARTREGRLQVELAQLQYLLPRLAGRGTAMSRLGGGIGTRGPGETQLETDRRRIGRRIAKLQQELENVRAHRSRQRRKRDAVPLPTVALVGYTNAGKSTLFNALTEAGVLADARMFATLDPTIRALDLPSRRRVLLSDTVGFISELPPGLIRAFRATLEEVTEADMCLHVVDASSESRADYIREVDKVLDELDALDKPQILVLNKTDRLAAQDVQRIQASEAGTGGQVATVAVSALQRTGLSTLIEVMDHHMPGDAVSTVHYLFGHDEGDKLSFLYSHGRIIERIDREEGSQVTAEAPASVHNRLTAHALQPQSVRRPAAGS